jgi:tRNA (guanine-N7-)-methyltransferase
VGEDGPRLGAQVGGALAERQRRLYGRRRARKLRAGRAALVTELLPRIEIALPVALDAGRETWLEIGFGAGEHLAEQAASHPGVSFIGVEPFFDGVAKLIAEIAARDLRNIRIYRDDARLLLAALPEAAIARGFVLFPDPWPKARHHKRRLLSRDGFALLARVMRAGAELRVATDDADYLAWIKEHAASQGSFALEAETRTRAADWPATRYEEKALKAGRTPAFLTFRRDQNPPKPLAPG